MTKSLQSAAEIIIGRLGKTRGLDGSLKIIPLTDFEGRFDNLREVTVGGKLMQVDDVQHIGGEIFVKLHGVDTRESARALTNKLLTVPRSEAAPLEDDDEFYTFDLIGCEVFDDSGRLGTVASVFKTGSNDVFQVTGDAEILIPALKSVIKKIDVQNKKILVDSKALETI